MDEKRIPDGFGRSLRNMFVYMFVYDTMIFSFFEAKKSVLFSIMVEILKVPSIKDNHYHRDHCLSTVILVVKTKNVFELREKEYTV